jgi:hypothetical protein
MWPHLVVRLFVRSFVRLFVRLFVCSFVRLFVCSFVRSLSLGIFIRKVSHNSQLRELKYFKFLRNRKMISPWSINWNSFESQEINQTNWEAFWNFIAILSFYKLRNFANFIRTFRVQFFYYFEHSSLTKSVSNHSKITVKLPPTKKYVLQTLNVFAYLHLVIKSFSIWHYIGCSWLG